MRFHGWEASHERGMDALALKKQQGGLCGADDVDGRALCHKGRSQVAGGGSGRIEDENILAEELIHWVPRSVSRSLGAGNSPAVPIDNHLCAPGD